MQSSTTVFVWHKGYIFSPCVKPFLFLIPWISATIHAERWRIWTIAWSHLRFFFQPSLYHTSKWSSLGECLYGPWVFPLCTQGEYSVPYHIYQINVLCFCLSEVLFTLFSFQVDEIYHDESLGTNINIVLVRMIMVGYRQVKSCVKSCCHVNWTWSPVSKLLVMSCDSANHQNCGNYWTQKWGGS